MNMHPTYMKKKTLSISEGCFDPANSLEKIRKQLHVMRKQRYRHSKLDRYRSELVALHQQGGSLREIAYWLKSERRIKMNVTSIARYLNKLSECHKNNPLCTQGESARDE